MRTAPLASIASYRHSGATARARRQKCQAQLLKLKNCDLAPELRTSRDRRFSLATHSRFILLRAPGEEPFVSDRRCRVTFMSQNDGETEAFRGAACETAAEIPLWRIPSGIYSSYPDHRHDIIHLATDIASNDDYLCIRGFTRERSSKCVTFRRASR